MEHSLNVALIEPQIPQNTGNIARTCAATGARLHLVGPMGFQIDEKKVRRAGLDYWDKLDITYYDSLEDFLQQNEGAAFYYFTTKARRAHSDVSYPADCFLVFGKETAGLPEELLKANPDFCVRQPMRGIIRSLNLSNSVAIGVYEVLRQWGYPQLSSKGELHKLSWED